MCYNFPVFYFYQNQAWYANRGLLNAWNLVYKQNGYWAKFGFAKLFILPVQPKWVVRKYGLHYRIAHGKLREITACGSILQYRNHPFNDCLGNISHSRSYIESGKFTSRVYPLIDECFARLRQNFKTMYEEMERTTKDESGNFRK